MPVNNLLTALLLTLLWTASPAVMWVQGLTQPPVQQVQRERVPYAGTIGELFAEQGALLTEAATLLWAHPEFFEPYREPEEFDAPFPMYDLLRGRTVQHPYTKDEWQTIMKMMEQPWMAGLWYHWGRVPLIACRVMTEESGGMMMYFVPGDLYSPEAIRNALHYHVQWGPWSEKVEGTDWTISPYPY